MLAFIFIILGTLLCLVPHPPNMAPIAALGLFGGANLSKKYALVVPLTAMFISDYFLGFHALMPWVYGSFFLIGLIGLKLKKRKTFQNILAASLASSLLFYLITNFGVWIDGRMYPPTFKGLMLSYYMALPFFRNTIVGDLLYTGLFFGAYELARSTSRKLATLQISNVKAQISNKIQNLDDKKFDI